MIPAFPIEGGVQPAGINSHWVGEHTSIIADPAQVILQASRISRSFFHTSAVSACGEAQIKTQFRLCFSLGHVWISMRNVWGLPVANGSTHFNSATNAVNGSPPGRFPVFSLASLMLSVKVLTSTSCFLLANTALARPR